MGNQQSKWYSFVDLSGNVQMVNSKDTSNLVKLFAVAEDIISGENLVEALRNTMLFKLNVKGEM